MNRKQNSLMRFSRTERLAQLSEQEIVIEKKKREIQAKLEAQKKKETEEALKKLEFSKETKGTKPGFSKKSWTGNDGEKSNDREKPVEKVKENLTNAFSNDGSFLDQFKKLSQSGLSSNCEAHIPTAETKKECDFKDFNDSNKESLSEKERKGKRGVENDRDKLESLKKNEKATKNIHLLPPLRNSSDSGVQLQTSRGFQYPQQQGVSVMSPVDNLKSTRPSFPIQDVTHHPVPELYSHNMPQVSNQPNYLITSQSIPPVPRPELYPNSNLKEFLPKEPSHSSLSSTHTQASQNISGPSSVQSSSEQKSELPKVRSEGISMTLKINPVKKLEAIPNPLENDEALSPDSLKKNQFTFSEKESSKSSSLGASLNCRSTRTTESVSSHDKDSSRVSPAFCNYDGDDEEDENKDDGHLTEKHRHWASLVARCGDEFEDSLRSRNENDPDLRFLLNKNSKEYLSYRKLILKLRKSLKSSDEEPAEKSRKLFSSETGSERLPESMLPSNKGISNDEDFKVKGYLGLEKMLSDSQKESKKISNFPENRINANDSNDASQATFRNDCTSNSQKQLSSKETSSQILKEENNKGESEQVKTEERRKRKRKSRWGDAEPTTSGPGIEKNVELQPPGKLPAPKSTLLSQLTRSDPGLIQYARQTFGSTNLSEEDWKKAEDHYKINLLYQDMIKKRAEVEKLEKQGKFKYEYDSDEDTEGGTWEHKLRQQEMQATQLWAEELTRQAAGKHHIGDFLPPEELERFMEKYNAVKEGREPDLSDYKEYKLKEDNVGYRLLQKMGWSEGQGLGQDGSGITNPVNKGATRHENQGLGVERPDGLEAGDDEYDAYRKRMMLAYRFRPNPLNNPRRPYY